MTNTGRPDQEHVLDRLEAICQTMMRAPADAGASRDVAFIADAAGRVQFITRAAAEALEAGGQERAGGPVEDLLEPGSWDLERLGLSQIVRSGLPMSFEGKATLADRETVLNTTLEPLGGAGGEARAALGIAREVTRRRGADAAAATAGEGLSRVFRDAPVPMLVVDSERVVRQLNGAAVRFVHRRRRDVVGRRIGDAVRCLHALGSPAGCGSGLLLGSELLPQRDCILPRLDFKLCNPLGCRSGYPGLVLEATLGHQLGSLLGLLLGTGHRIQGRGVFPNLFYELGEIAEVNLPL